MLDHHIQKTIVYTLAFSDRLRFSELKPDTLENKAFDYHLKKVVQAGYVTKNDDGTYSLTSEGKRVGKGALGSQNRMIDRAYSILLMAIRRKSDGAWLLYKRQTQPLLGLTGFMQAQPVAGTNVPETAREECLVQTGIDAKFSVHGHGYFRLYRNGELESFIHFTLLVCEDIDGNPVSSDSYYWDEEPDFEAETMLPTMQALRTMYDAPAGGFIEETFEL